MKNTVFINFSNHPSDKWGEKQRNLSLEYGEIVDIKFPEVDENGDEDYVIELADECVKKIVAYQPAAVLCQGEFTLAYAVIKRLREHNITVLAGCTQRIVEETGTEKKSVFVFSRYRKYE